MTISNNQTVKASCVWTVADVATQVNVFHLLLTGIVAQTQAQIRDDIQSWFTGLYGPLTSWMSNVLTHNRIDLFNVSGNNPESGIGRVSTLDGTSSGQVLPLQVSAEIYYRTVTSRHIGRTFLPVMTEAANAGDVLELTLRSDLQDFGDAVIVSSTEPNGVDVQMVIRDRSAGMNRIPVQALVPIRWRTQRRRRVGVGI